jgi:exosortase
MKWKKKLHSTVSNSIHEALKTAHGRIVLSGVLSVLCYLIFWFGVLLFRSFHGSASGLLQAAAVYLALQQLWNQRQRLQQMATPTEDRLLGHILILAGVVLLPVCLITTWSDPFICWLIAAIDCVLILAGVVCSCWGAAFFGAYPLPTFLVCLGLLPKPAEISRAFWQALTPPEMLERFMAWSGGLALHAIGQPAVVDGVFISLSNGAAKIGWGCNGFDMAATMVVASFVLGLFLKQSRSKIMAMMAIGAILALASNIPRIMLVTIAAVYWGKYWFDFWHDSWGSQIFVSVLFTIYYYVIMGLVKRRPKKLRL